ncbi:MAG: helix-turn-helix transcriptional regulator [Chryseobacterium sp.]|nr:helix-turn-helix transcriptional regulator [Chryseobacterium sp.]
MNTIVSEKIKRLRKAKGLSQEEMADKLHIS